MSESQEPWELRVKNGSRFFAIASTAILLHVVAPPALAQWVANARGAGTVGCGEFLEDRNADRYKQYYTQWVMGYLSSYNMYKSQTALQTIPDEATIDAYLQKHCRDSPLDGIIRATMFLIRDLGGYSPPGLQK